MSHARAASPPGRQQSGGSGPASGASACYARSNLGQTGGRGNVSRWVQLGWSCTPHLEPLSLLWGALAWGHEPYGSGFKLWLRRTPLGRPWAGDCLQPVSVACQALSSAWQ